MRKFLHLILGILILSGGIARAGDSSVEGIDTSYFKGKKHLYFGKKPLKNFYIGGTYHGYLYYRDVKEMFDGTYEQQKTTLGNNGTTQLQLELSGRPTQNTIFKSNVYIYNGMYGPGYDTSRLYVGYSVTMEGQTKTDVANFQYIVGGIQYTKLSKLTLWTNENNGESLFEVNPWASCTKAGTNYESYYSQGTIIRDFRWGNQPVQGATLNITELPYGIEAKGVYGKTPSNGGQSSYLKTIPDVSYGSLIKKYFGKDYVGFNTFSGKTRDDSINGQITGYSVLSLDFNLELKKLMTISGEYARGYNRESTTLEQRQGDALDFNLLTNNEFTYIPFKLHFYYLGSKFVSTNGGFNSFLTTTTGFNGLEASSNPVGAYMSDIDYINGNRQGFDIRTELNIKGLKVNLANGFSEEVDHLTNKISYGHRISDLVFSSIYSYQSNAGPYGRLTTGYRSFYETTGLDTLNADYPTGKFRFNVMEANLKYKIKLFNKAMYFFYLASYSSVQGKLSAIPVFSDEAYVRAQYHELEAFYNISSMFALTSYFGFEHIKENDLTYKAENGKTSDQRGRSVGLGCDFQFGDFVNLYVRARWYDYKDKNFLMSRFNGYEGSIDMRIYF